MRQMTVEAIRSKIISYIFPDESSYYELDSIDTVPFTPPHTPTIPLLHSISTTSTETQ